MRIYEEAKNLESLGNKVTICTYSLGNDIPGIDTRRIINTPWYKKLSAGPSIHKIYLDLLLLLKSVVVARQVRPDVIHAHLNEGALIGKICSWLLGIPMVFDVQGEFTSEVTAHKFMKDYPFLHKVIYMVSSLVERFSYKTSNALLANSYYMSNRLIKNHKIRKDAIFVVPDAAGLPDTIQPGEVESLRKMLHLPSDKKIVTYLGLLTEYQGVDLLLNVVKSITEKRTDVHFLIMGYPDVERYKKISDDLNISQHVTFTGRIAYPDIYKYLALGTIAVSPKLLDAGGEANIKIYNYIVAGLPTVAFDYIVNREILGDLGIYARQRDPISLESCINMLLDDDQLRLDIAKRLRAINIESYSWRDSTNKLLQAYSSVTKVTNNTSNQPKSKQKKPQETSVPIM